MKNLIKNWLIFILTFPLVNLNLDVKNKDGFDFLLREDEEMENEINQNKK
jgi:hypothetical protein